MELHEHTKHNVIWQYELSQSVTRIDELCRLLNLPKSLADHSVASDYPLFVPRPFLRLMEKGNPFDPLLLQVLPRTEENIAAIGFSDDPVGERVSVSSGNDGRILKKYPGRALLLTTESCGIRCRFCFRRYLPNCSQLNLFDCNDLESLFDPICNDSTIEEVILSGGDPLMLDDGKLGRTLHYIVKIPHVKRIRIHSRLPIVLPNRITAELVETMALSKPVYLVLHVNHPNELSSDFLLRRQMFAETVVMSQTVLLKGVNDNVDTLARLFETLIDHRIVPYYLHQLDRVRGAAHFEVLDETGRRLVDELRNRLPGYAVPKYVREVAGEPGKRMIE